MAEEVTQHRHRPLSRLRPTIENGRRCTWHGIAYAFAPTPQHVRSSSRTQQLIRPHNVEFTAVVPKHYKGCRPGVPREASSYGQRSMLWYSVSFMVLGQAERGLRERALFHEKKDIQSPRLFSRLWFQSGAEGFERLGDTRMSKFSSIHERKRDQAIAATNGPAVW